MQAAGEPVEIRNMPTPFAGTRRKGRHAALFNIPDAGHLNPMLAFTAALKASGCEVHFYSPTVTRERVEAVGAVWHRFGDDNLDLIALAKDVVVSRLGLEVPPDVVLPVWNILVTLAVMPELLASLARLRPDFVAFDAAAPWRRVAAEILKLPAVSIMTALPMSMAERAVSSAKWSPEAQRALEEAGRTISAAYGVEFDHNHSYTQYAPYTIVASSRAWHKGHEDFPTHQYHYWGSMISERKGFADSNKVDSVSSLLAAGAPLVYCSLGTVCTGIALQKCGKVVSMFYTNFLQAAALLPDVNFVVAIGKGAEVEESLCDGQIQVMSVFGQPVPQNVVVARSVNQVHVLKHASLFVSHCGQNSCTEAIDAAVPVLGVPISGDQPENAQRFVELGCGLMRSIAEGGPSNPADLTPEMFVTDMRRLLQEPGFKEAAEALSGKQQKETGQPIGKKMVDLLKHLDLEEQRLEEQRSGILMQLM